MSDSVGSHRQQPSRLPRPWDSPGKNTGVGYHFLLQCMKVKVTSLSRVRLLATPWTAAYQAPPSMGFSRQEYWSGVPLPSPTIKILACAFIPLDLPLPPQHHQRSNSFFFFHFTRIIEYVSTDWDTDSGWSARRQWFILNRHRQHS